MSEDLALIAIALLGCMVGCVVALLPGVHVYSIAAIAFALASRGLLFTEAQLAMVLLGALVGWSVVNVIPAVFLFAPDDANALVVLPGTKLLMRGRGNDAVLLTAAGSVGALCVLMLLSPIFDELLRPLRTIIQPHAGWMLVAVITFLVLGEWPRANDRATTPVARLASAWVYLGAGLLTFVLSGLLGLALMYRSPIAIEQAYQNLMPAFVGLFTIPGIIQLAFLGQQPPKQTFSNDINLPPGLLLRGTLTGVVGGLFAGVLPVVSGGIGGLLAGHATAQRDDRLFLISMGASKVAYYLGSVLLLFGTRSYAHERWVSRHAHFHLCALWLAYLLVGCGSRGSVRGIRVWCACADGARGRQTRAANQHQMVGG